MSISIMVVVRHSEKYKGLQSVLDQIIGNTYLEFTISAIDNDCDFHILWYYNKTSLLIFTCADMCKHCKYKELEFIWQSIPVQESLESIW